MRKAGEENQKTTENILALYESKWVSKSHVASEKSSNSVRNWGGKSDKGLIDKKSPNWWRGRREKPKDHKV